MDFSDFEFFIFTFFKIPYLKILFKFSFNLLNAIVLDEGDGVFDHGSDFFYYCYFLLLISASGCGVLGSLRDFTVLNFLDFEFFLLVNFNFFSIQFFKFRFWFSSSMIIQY